MGVGATPQGTGRAEDVARLALHLHTHVLYPTQRHKTAPLRKALTRALHSQGWYIPKVFHTATRGNATGKPYRGRIALVAWPPLTPEAHGQHGFHDPSQWPHLGKREPPLLIEFGKYAVKSATRTKIQTFGYPTSGALVILTKATPEQAQQAHGQCHEIDRVIGLGV